MIIILKFTYLYYIGIHCIITYHAFTFEFQKFFYWYSFYLWDQRGNADFRLNLSNHLLLPQDPQ